MTTTLRTVLQFLLAAAAVAFQSAAAAPPPAARPPELINSYSPTGPTEISGVVAASRSLRMVQRYSASAPTDFLAVQLAGALGESFGEPVTVTRKSRTGGSEGTLFV